MSYKIIRDASYQGSVNQTSDDLQHFKYIKREKGPNGKWVYYYDKEQLKDDLGVNQKKELDKQHDTAVISRAYLNYTKDEFAAAQKKAKETTNGLPYHKAEQTLDYKNMKNKEEQYLKAIDKMTNEAKKYYEMQKEFHKTPLGKLDKIKEKGKDLIENILNKNIWDDFTKMKKRGNR